MEARNVLKALVCIAVIGFVGFIVRLYECLVRKPNEVRTRLNKQGVGGPKPVAVLGNLLDMRKARSSSSPDHDANKSQDGQPQVFHNYTAGGILTFFESWRQQYGKVFTFAMGNKQIIHVTRPESVKEITQSASMNLGRPSYNSWYVKLVGLLFLPSFHLVSSQQQFPRTDSPSSPAKNNFGLALGLAAVFVVILATGYCCWRARSTPEDEGDTERAVVEEEEEEEPEDEGDIEMGVVEEEEEEECPICFEDMRDEQSAHPLPQCNDKFHDHCILQWSSRTGSNACPICCRTP